MQTILKHRRETTAQKAARLVQNYRAIKLDQHVFVVIGDHSTYQVSHVAGNWACNCPWDRFKSHVKPCSHVQASRAALADPVSQLPVAPLARMLAHASN